MTTYWKQQISHTLSHTCTRVMTYIDCLAEGGMTHTFLSSSSFCLWLYGYSQFLGQPVGWWSVWGRRSHWTLPAWKTADTSPPETHTFPRKPSETEEQISLFQGTLKGGMEFILAAIQQWVAKTVTNMKVQLTGEIYCSLSVFNLNTQLNLFSYWLITPVLLQNFKNTNILQLLEQLRGMKNFRLL